MTMTDLERNEALIHMVQSGAFPDDLALARWSVTAEAIPILQRWLEAGRRCRPRAATDLDMEAVKAALADEDALAADIQARFGAAAFPPLSVNGAVPKGTAPCLHEASTSLGTNRSIGSTTACHSR